MLQRVKSRGITSALFLAGLIAGIVVVPGCKKSEDAIAEAALKQATGKDVDVTRDGESMTIKAGDAEIQVATAEEGGTVALPADFPEDVFLPAQRAVNSAMDMGGMKMVNITTAALPAAVSAEVETAMQAQGWKREMAMQAEGSSTLIYTKDKRQAVYQMMKGEGGGTQLAIRAGGG